jgi:hypothetical protein
VSGGRWREDNSSKNDWRVFSRDAPCRYTTPRIGGQILGRSLARAKKGPAEAGAKGRIGRRSAVTSIRRIGFRYEAADFYHL